MKKYKWNSTIIVCTILMLIVLLTGCITVKSTTPPKQPSTTPDNESSNPPTASQAKDLPVIMSFSVNPGEVNPGDEATLSWDVTKADSVNIEPKIGYVSASGSIIVTPKENTVYTLTASNSAGESKATTSINVARNENAKLIALTLDDVANNGFTFQSDKTPNVSDAVSTYSIMFVRGEEILTNTVYVYPTLALAQQYYYSIRSRQNTTAQDIYTIRQQKAFVDSDRSLAPEKPEKYLIGLTKGNVYVELGWINNFKELENYALILEARIK